MAIPTLPSPSSVVDPGFEDPPSAARVFRDAALIFVLVLAAALFGILTRPIGLLAAFWPANALLLGTMLRVPRLATRWGWLAAAAGYLCTDLATGADLTFTAWLSAGNMVMAGTGFLLFRRLSDEDRELRRPSSMLYLFVICVAASLASASVGAGAASAVLGREPLTGFAYWFTAEFVNSCVILPVVLTAPAAATMRARWRWRRPAWASLLPVAALVASMVAAVAVGGPGAVAFPVPALLWCALSYSLFATASLTLAVSVWEMLAASTGVLPLLMSVDAIDSTTSVRLAIALLALGPVTVASVNSARNDLLRSLVHATNYDFLTDVLTRSAFIQRAQALLAEAADLRAAVVVMMLDIDDFKGVNDRHGHAAGDRVLVALTRTIARVLGDRDVFGRLGGEEFAVVLCRVTRAEAAATAERVRQAVEQTHVPLKNGSRLGTTVSIGLAYGTDNRATIDSLLSAADQALYRAKLAGRNRVEVVDHQQSGTGLPPAGHTRSHRGLPVGGASRSYANARSSADGP